MNTRDPAKRFEDADLYSSDIKRVVPGHGLLRELALATLQVSLPREGELLIVGAGPGPELVDAAAVLPGWQIDALEPSLTMFNSASAAIDAAGLGHRVRLHNRPLTPPSGPVADAVLCLLVTHLIPDDGPRAAFWRALGSSLRLGGLLVLAEIEALDDEERAIWRAWSQGQGCGPERLATLDQRLSTGFSMLAPDQTSTHAAQAGLTQDGLVLRALGLSLSRWRRRH